MTRRRRPEDRRGRLLPFWRAPIWHHEPPRPLPARAWRLGSIAGIPIYVAPGVAVLPVCMLVVALVVGWWERELLAFNVGAALAYALQLVVHEGAHALVAARALPVWHVVFGFHGGAVDSGHPERPSPPSRIAAIAAAGPAGNLLLGIGCLVLAVVTAGTVSSLWFGGAMANVGVAVANLLPLTSRAPVGRARTDGALIVAAIRAGRTGITGGAAAPRGSAARVDLDVDGPGPSPG